MNDDKKVFRNVAVPIEVYDMLDDLAKADQRSKARQLSVMIKRAHDEMFAKN